MGLGGISIWELLIVFAIVITIFGAGRLRTIGTDLGAAIRGFRQGLKDDADPAARELPPVSDGEPTHR